MGARWWNGPWRVPAIAGALIVASLLASAAGAPSATYPLPAADPRQAALVLDRVRDFTVSGWIDGSGWQPLPRPPGANTPVTGLQIVITRDGGNQDETYRRVIAFP